MYDPDSLALTKDQILKMIDETLTEYDDNKKVKAIGWFLKQFCKRAEPKDLESLWGTIAVKVNKIFIENSLKHAINNGEKWAETFKLLDKDKKEDEK